MAVVDSGVSQEGEDLGCLTFVAPYNAITDTTGDIAADDDNGHGTHVAGTVAQCTNNGVGVAGIAFDASLMPIKVLDSSGKGDLSWVARGVDWATTNGADVINMSLGCECSSSILSEAIETAAQAGIVVVAASGNSGLNSVAFPASHPEVIAVGSVDYNLAVADYSNQGPKLDLVAPGGDVSQDANGDGFADGVLQETFELKGINKDFAYFFFQGTSMAAPHVSGAAALLLSSAPGADPGTIEMALETTALDLGAAGFDTTYGNGLLQLRDAIDYLATLDTTAPIWDSSAQLTVRTYGETELDLQWSGAIDDVGVTGYLLRLLGSTFETELTSQETQVTGLNPGTSYVFEVLARDEAGNWSESLSASVGTARHFTDTNNHLFYQDILWLSGKDITRGCNPPTNDLFCPNDGVTRETLAAFMVRALSLTENTHPGFIDVSVGSTFAEDIGRLATAGITKGCNPPDNDRFCPLDDVDRGQLAAFFRRGFG